MSALRRWLTYIWIGLTDPKPPRVPGTRAPQEEEHGHD